MNPIKTVVKSAISKAGYTLRRADDVREAEIRPENFVNLTQAYEHYLNTTYPDRALAPNPLRAKLLGRLLGTPPSEAYAVLQGLAKTRTVEGDVCEFGVAQGETSALIANEISDTKKLLHLFDSFEGLPAPTEKDRLQDDIFNLGSMEAYTGTMACKEDLVRARLDAIGFPKDRFVIYKGFFNDVLKSGRKLPSVVSFAYVDFDFYEPILQALEFLHERMPVGASIVVDDYGWFSTGAETATNEFLAAKNAAKKQYTCYVPKVMGGFAVIDRVG
jgi:O-methyltransferase